MWWPPGAKGTLLDSILPTARESIPSPLEIVRPVRCGGEGGLCVMLTMIGLNGLWVRILVRAISATSIQNRVPEVVLMDNHQL